MAGELQAAKLEQLPEMQLADRTTQPMSQATVPASRQQLSRQEPTQALHPASVP